MVITIIVLLILAGVSIATLTGENGILTQANKAKEETQKAEIKERVQLEVVGELAKPGEKVEGTENKFYINNGVAKIPVGVMIVPGCEKIDDGLVISDDPDDTEEDPNNIVAEGNQFVWIPVTSEGQYVRNTTYQLSIVSTAAYTDKGYLPDDIQPEIPEGKQMQR